MNKFLLGTTALVATSFMMTAGGAYAAEDKAKVTKPKVTVSGGLKFEIGGGDQDSEAVGTKNSAHRGYAFRTDSEIAVKASGKTDAGMKWSAKVEIEADEGSGGSIDESVIGFSGSWGKI